MAAPYSAVARALQDLGSSVQGGFRDLGNARMSAAELALRQARQEHDIKKEEFLFPQMKLDRDNAIRETQRQAELDQPLDTNYLMQNTFSGDVKGYELEHYFTNDIPGTSMKALGIKYDQKNDRYMLPNGKVATKRDFVRGAPVYQSVILAKTDYVKRAKDELADAIKNKDNVKAVKLRKLLEDPNRRFHLDVYDKQEQALLDQKARFSQLPEGVLNLGYIDDSIERIRRKRDEILKDVMLNKKLAADKTRLSKEWTSEQRAKAWQWASEQARERVDAMRERGGFTKKVPGSLYGTNDEPWTEQEIEAYERNLAVDLFKEQANVAGYLVKDTDAKADTGTPSDGTSNPAAPGGWSAIKKKHEAGMKETAKKESEKKTPSRSAGPAGSTLEKSGVAPAARRLRNFGKKQASRFKRGGKLYIRDLKNKAKYSKDPLEREEARQELDKLREEGLLK